MRVGQPAVSKAIARLEEWLVVRLLLRSTRSLTPTEAGMNFYVRAKCSIEEAEEAVLAARGAGAALTGKLRIAASVCFGRLRRGQITCAQRAGQQISANEVLKVTSRAELARSRAQLRPADRSHGAIRPLLDIWALKSSTLERNSFKIGDLFALL